MTKRAFHYILAVAALFASGCSNGTKPESVAEDFLKAYVSTDYAKAASYCTPELEQDLNRAVEELDNLSDEIKELIKRHTRNFTPKVDSVEEIKGKDTVIVFYSIVNINKEDTLSVSGTQVIESQLSLVKSEEGWKIAALNNNKKL